MARNEKNRLELGLDLWSCFFLGADKWPEMKKKNSCLELGLDLCS